MTFELLPTLPDALRILSETTDAEWDRAKFFKAVVDHSLPLRATTPNDCWPVIESMGKQHDAGLPALGHRRHALLSRSAIRDLALHSEASTYSVALEPGDPDFMTWPEIKARRLEREQELADRAYTAEEWDALSPWSSWLPADFMGESDLFMLSCAAKVTDESCRVPTETIEELQALAPKRAPTKASMAKTVHSMKRNSLDGPIEEAIRRAGSTSSGIVWIQLRELALEGMLPFTGEVEGDVLYYTDDNNKPAKLTKDAVKKRLQKYRRVTTP